MSDTKQQCPKCKSKERATRKLINYSDHEFGMHEGYYDACDSRWHDSPVERSGEPTSSGSKEPSTCHTADYIAGESYEHARVKESSNQESGAASDEGKNVQGLWSQGRIENLSSGQLDKGADMSVLQTRGGDIADSRSAAGSGAREWLEVNCEYDYFDERCTITRYQGSCTVEQDIPTIMDAYADHCTAQKDAELTAERTRREAAERELKELREAIGWALGEIDDFPERQPGQGAYWWRSELRKRCGAALRGKGE